MHILLTYFSIVVQNYDCNIDNATPLPKKEIKTSMLIVLKLLNTHFISFKKKYISYNLFLWLYVWYF